MTYFTDDQISKLQKSIAVCTELKSDALPSCAKSATASSRSRHLYSIHEKDGTCIADGYDLDALKEEVIAYVERQCDEAGRFQEDYELRIQDEEGYETIKTITLEMFPDSKYRAGETR